MFREVLLHPEDRDLHRYLARDEYSQITDYRMKRVTFGVTSSPFLASSTLRRIAKDHESEHFTAPLMSLHFYVDDFLYGSNTIEEALAIREDINPLLAKRKMHLRKWRTNSSELMSSIPEELRESEPLQLGSGIEGCPKALDVHWQVKNDHLYVATPPPLKTSTPTKRQVASQTAKVYDVFGWFAPTTVKAKSIIQ